MTTFCQAGTFTILDKNALCRLYVNPKIAQLRTNRVLLNTTLINVFRTKRSCFL